MQFSLAGIGLQMMYTETPHTLCGIYICIYICTGKMCIYDAQGSLYICSLAVVRPTVYAESAWGFIYIYPTVILHINNNHIEGQS